MKNVSLQIKGAIFDLDGTLLDSMPIWKTISADYLRAQDIRPKDGLTEDTKRMTLRQVARLFQDDYGLNLTVQEIESGVNRMIESYYRFEAPVKEGANDLLETLARQGVKMCVVTATDRYLAEAALRRCGLLSYVQEVITCGDFGAGKDEPAIFEYALSRLGTPKPFTPVFEDAVHAAETAKESGFPVIAVFDPAFAEAEDRLRALADLYLQSPAEMLGRL
jgi:HAD superfamily hydrolase (TIGR01509 family)